MSLNAPFAEFVLRPVFRLRAVPANGKLSPRDGLRLGALTVLRALAERFRGAVPERLQNLPDPARYRGLADEAIGSFRFERGISVEVRARFDLGEWALRVSEPETGEGAVPGRMILTEAAFRVDGDRLRCGFRVGAAEPSGAAGSLPSELPGVVLALLNEPGFGLRQGDAIPTAARRLDTSRAVDVLASLLADGENDLPAVVLLPGVPEPARLNVDAPPEENAVNAPWRDLLVPGLAKKDERPDGARRFAALDRRPANDFFNHMASLPDDFTAGKDKLPPSRKDLLLTMPNQELKKISRRLRVKVEEKNAELLANDENDAAAAAAGEADRLSEALTARARVYVLVSGARKRFCDLLAPSAGPGDVLTFLPAGAEDEIAPISGRLSAPDRSAALKSLAETLIERSRRAAVDLSGVNFAPSPPAALPRDDSEKLDELERAWRAKLDDAQKRHGGELKTREKKNRALTEQLARNKEYIARLEAEKEQLRSELAVEAARLKSEEAEKDEEIACLRRRLDRPAEHNGIADWVRRSFRGRLILHARAEALLADKSARDVDLGLICDALDFLATDWWSRRYEQIGDDEMNTRCSKKYGRPFAVSPTGKATVAFTPTQYKIKYFRGAKGKLVETPLDFHLGVGNDPENLLRIYFLHDDEKKLIVVGSLPRHLKAVTIE